MKHALAYGLGKIGKVGETSGSVQETLLKALRVTVRALEQHIKDEAEEKGVKPSVLCPCMENEVVQAREAIQLAEQAPKVVPVNEDLAEALQSILAARFALLHARTDEDIKAADEAMAEALVMADRALAKAGSEE